jgi:hypothetical protein
MLSKFVRCLFFLGFFVIAPSALAADPGMTLDPRIGLNAYAALVDQQLSQARDGLRIVAASDNAASGDWDRIKGLLAVFAKGTPTAAAVWFARPDDTYFTVDGGRMTKTLSDRDYFPGLMAGHEEAGDLVVSKATGKRSSIIAIPVYAGGHVVGAVGVSIDMDKVAALVQDKIGFPTQVTFYALDEQGQAALHRDSKLLFEFAGRLGSPTLAQAVTQMLAKPEGTVRYEFQGVQRTVVFKKSAMTRWVYALRW